MAEAEQPERSTRPVSVADIHQIASSATPHFALQLRERIRRLITDLPIDDPARSLGEREIERLTRLAFSGQVNGEAQTGEPSLPSVDPSAAVHL